MPPDDANVVLVAEGRDRQIDARRSVGGGLRLRPLQARVTILLGELGGLVLPRFGNAANLDLPLLSVAVALLGSSNDRGNARRPPFEPSDRGTARVQIRSENLEIHNGVQPLEIVALGRKLLQPIVDVEEPVLVTHPIPPDSTGSRESAY